MANTARITITMTKPQLTFLEKEAKRLGLSVPELVRRIVDQHREEKQ